MTSTHAPGTVLSDGTREAVVVWNGGVVFSGAEHAVAMTEAIAQMNVISRPLANSERTRIFVGVQEVVSAIHEAKPGTILIEKGDAVSATRNIIVLHGNWQVCVDDGYESVLEYRVPSEEVRIVTAQHPFRITGDRTSVQSASTPPRVVLDEFWHIQGLGGDDPQVALRRLIAAERADALRAAASASTDPEAATWLLDRAKSESPKS